MRVGAGAVKLICDKESAQILEPQISVELIAVIKNKNEFQSMLKDKKISSVLIGPGNTISDETKARTLLALAFIDHVVIDADAITSFENSPDELFIDTYAHKILTPHEGEEETRLPSISQIGLKGSLEPLCSYSREEEAISLFPTR